MSRREKERRDMPGCDSVRGARCAPKRPVSVAEGLCVWVDTGKERCIKQNCVAVEDGMLKWIDRKGKDERANLEK